MWAQGSGRHRGRYGALALGIAVLLGAARAQAADAGTLETELHDWLGSLLGPNAGLGQRPVRLTPQDGHFALEVPISGAVGRTAIVLDGPPLTATARGLDGGRWALDDIRLPSPLRVTLPGPHGASIGTITMQEQEQHAVVDPRLATTSTWDGRIGGYATRWRGPDGDRHSEAAHLHTHIAWQPAGGGRLDVTETASSDLISSSTRVEQVGVVSFSAGHAQVEAHIDRLAPGQVPLLLRAMLDLMPTLMTAASSAAAAPATHHLTPEARAALATALDAAGDLLSGFGEQVRLQNVHVHAPTFDAAMRSVEFGASGAAPEGRLRLRLHLAMDGFDSGALPDGPLHDYLPRHIAFTPRLSGLAADRVLALLRKVVASDGNDPALAGEAQALMWEGPLAIGLDELAADFGPAVLSASGEVRIAGPDQVTGQARIRMTGLEALIHDMQALPMLQQALPVLIFLKGIGAPEAGATVWNVAYADGRVTVNGTDLSQMMPGK
jgi:hypothetical protein